MKGINHQMDSIHIDSHKDFISAEDGYWPERGPEMLNLLSWLKIKNVLFAGVATTECVLNKPFGIKAVRTWMTDNNGTIKKIALIRELTDVSQNMLAWRPDLTLDELTKIALRFVEAVWAPTVSVEDILSAAGSNGQV